MGKGDPNQHWIPESIKALTPAWLRESTTVKLVAILCAAALVAFWLFRPKEESGNHTSGNMSPIMTGNRNSYNSGNNSPVVNVGTVTIPASDYIDGTKFTHKQLDETFPFGYAVFRFDGGISTYEPHTNDQLKIKFAWSDIKLTPDFGHGLLHVDIPDLDIEWPNHNVAIKNSATDGDTGMTVGVLYFIPFYSRPNVPLPFVCTLSDNQLHPVFAFGFRIPKAK
jgi:hypothetical protein